MIYQIGQKFRHKQYGFIGILNCIDHWSNLHIISLEDGEEKRQYCDILKRDIVEYPGIIQWKGPSYQIEEKFDLI